MDLLSLVLSLRPIEGPEPPSEVPAWWGRAAHALLLNTIQRHDEQLAASLHAGTEGVRPFTVSTLMGHFARGALQSGETYTLRLSAFRLDLAQILLAEAGSGSLAAGQILELDYLPFEIVASQAATPWAAQTTYQELSAPYLLARRNAPRRITLQFTSPTTFKSAGKHVPLPLPELVFGSLLERWNAFAPIAFPPEVKRYAAECLALSKYDLETRTVPMKSGGLRVGAVGRATYTTLSYDRYWMSLIATLAEFALFAGVGAGTSMGLGQVRQVDL